VVLVAGTNSVVPRLVQAGVRPVICAHVDAPADDAADLDRLLVSDELFVMGAARAADPGYQFDDRSLLVETDPASGRLAVTTNAFDCFALVRYRLDLADSAATGRARDARV